MKSIIFLLSFLLGFAFSDIFLPPSGYKNCDSAFTKVCRDKCSADDQHSCYCYEKKIKPTATTKDFLLCNCMDNENMCLGSDFEDGNTNLLFDEKPDKDYYKILNLEENADSAQIKKAFYTLSVKHHPDKGGKEEDFKSINSAYEVLKSEKDKKIYDKLRSDYFEDLKRRIKLNNRKGDSFSKQQKEDSGKKEKRKYQSDYYYSNNFYNYQEYNYKRNKQHSQYQDSYYNDTNNDFYSDYKHNFKEDTSDKNFDATYQEFMEMMRKYYEDQQESNKANYSENRFDKFKVNVKYIPLEKQKLYEDFKIEPVHRHHMDNRIKKYKLELEKQLRLQNRRFLKYKTKTIAKNLNPFEIYSDMNTDKDFIKAMNSELHCSDDESLQSKFTFKEIFKVFDKRKATAFLFLNFILAYILLK